MSASRCGQYNNNTYGGELSRTLSNQSADVLALELGDELLETLVISLNANSTEDLLDVGRRRGRVATNLEEEVCSEMTHLVEDQRLRTPVLAR